jgi:hypothetical protein
MGATRRTGEVLLLRDCQDVLAEPQSGEAEGQGIRTKVRAEVQDLPLPKMWTLAPGNKKGWQ